MFGIHEMVGRNVNIWNAKMKIQYGLGEIFTIFAILKYFWF